MTAVIGILNKKAVAIAADSAVTLHNGKIFNKANKLFTLSKYHPVGIMIHNLADFMGTPWETIIKAYRKQLKNTSFDTVEMYKDNFIGFIKGENFFCDTNHQILEFNRFCVGINDLFIDQIGKELKQGEADYDNKFLALLKEKANAHITKFSTTPKVLPDFAGYTYADFSAYVDVTIQPVFDYSFIASGITIDADYRELLKQAYYYEFVVKEFYTSGFTGVVFAGFGEKEMFPSLISLNVYIGFDNKLRYFINEENGSVISHNNPSDIRTFAQSDVMFTILRGIAPELQDTYNLNFGIFFDKYNDLLISNYPNEDKGDLKYLLSRIDRASFTTEFIKLMEEVIHRKYVNPLYEAIAGLAKEDLGEMAESLIYLTYLQRRITNAEETVGGPVDVAILSKGDGFIWLKRKHYFNPELNKHFFKNYFS